MADDRKELFRNTLATNGLANGYGSRGTRRKRKGLRLALVVLLTATTKSQEGNSHFGLAIGSALVAGAKAVGGISGGALNPAIGIALPVLKDDGMDDIWIYVVGPLVGGLLAAGAFYLLEKPSELR